MLMGYLVTYNWYSNVFFRCRSAFKLLEIDQKYNIIKPGFTVIDCGAAPGSWSQLAVQQSNADGSKPDKPKGMVVGIDLLQIYPIPVGIRNNHFCSTPNATLSFSMPHCWETRISQSRKRKTKSALCWAEGRWTAFSPIWLPMLPVYVP